MRKPAIFSALLLVFVCTGVSAQDGLPREPSAESIKIAHELLTATHAEDNVQIGIDALTPALVAQLKRDKADIPDAVIQQFMAIFRQEMKDSLPEILDAQAKVYASHYTTSELQSLVQFYQSDIGKKVITETPSILKETLALGQAWGRSTGQRAAQDTIAKLRAQGVKI